MFEAESIDLDSKKRPALVYGGGRSLSLAGSTSGWHRVGAISRPNDQQAYKACTGTRTELQAHGRKINVLGLPLFFSLCVCSVLVASQ